MEQIDLSIRPILREEDGISTDNFNDTREYNRKFVDSKDFFMDGNLFINNLKKFHITTPFLYEDEPEERWDMPPGYIRILGSSEDFDMWFTGGYGMSQDCCRCGADINSVFNKYELCDQCDDETSKERDISDFQAAFMQSYTPEEDWDDLV